jgi:hypothetical protein
MTVDGFWVFALGVGGGILAEVARLFALRESDNLPGLPEISVLLGDYRGDDCEWWVACNPLRD